MRNFTVFTLFFTLIAPFTSFGRSGATWLEIGPGGRAAGLAGAMTASALGPTSTYWNPAAVGYAGNGIEAMHSDWIAGTVSQFVAGEFKLGSSGLGLSILHVGTGDMKLRDKPSDQPSGEFEARRYAIGASFAQTLPFHLVRVGISARYLSDVIYIYDANGWSMDLGIFLPNAFQGILDLGATVRHFGALESFEHVTYELPTTCSAGIVWRPGGIGWFKPSIIIDGVQVIDEDFSLKVAVESYLTDLLVLRAGYGSGFETHDISGGFGLHWKRWRFEYGYTPFRNDLGAAQRLSFVASW